MGAEYAFLFWKVWKQPFLQMFFKMGLLKHFTIFTRKHLCWSLFLISCRASVLQLYWKETPTQVFSCEHCEIFKNSYFYRKSLVDAWMWSHKIETGTSFLSSLSEVFFKKNISNSLEYWKKNIHCGEWIS